MKIKNYLAVAITLLSLGMFVACNSNEEYDETFANNEKILKSEFAKSTIAPTKTIPAAIRAKMDSVELDIFSKLSTIGYVDYSFFDTEYYAENKQKILKRLYLVYNQYVEEGKENIYFSICSPDKRLDNLRAVGITPTELENHAVFLRNLTSDSFSFDFIVTLGIETDHYSYEGFIMTPKSIPENYSLYLGWGDVNMASSGLACVLSLDMVYMNDIDSTLLPVSKASNVSLNFPPQPPTTLSLGN